MRNFIEQRVAGPVLDLATTPGTLADGTPLRYGLGLALGSYRGLRAVSHGGVDSGYRAELLWFPEADFGVVVLANLSTIKPGALARRVADLYLADQLGPDDLLDAQPVALPNADLEAVTGLYRDTRTSLTRLLKLEDSKLTVNGPFGDRLELVPLGDGRFRLGEPPLEARIAPGPDGTLSYREWSPDGRELAFSAAPLATPTAETLASYAGTYACADLGVRYTLLVRGDRLVLRRRKPPDCELEPTIADAFSLPQFDIVFSRDGRGDVSGLDVFAERIRYLRFERER